MHNINVDITLLGYKHLVQNTVQHIKMYALRTYQTTKADTACQLIPLRLAFTAHAYPSMVFPA